MYYEYTTCFSDGRIAHEMRNQTYNPSYPYQPIHSANGKKCHYSSKCNISGDGAFECKRHIFTGRTSQLSQQCRHLATAFTTKEGDCIPRSERQIDFHWFHNFWSFHYIYREGQVVANLGWDYSFSGPAPFSPLDTWSKILLQWIENENAKLLLANPLGRMC